MNTKILGLLLIAGLSAIQVEAAAMGKIIIAPLIGLQRAMNPERQEPRRQRTQDDEIVAGYAEARGESKCCIGAGCLACGCAAAIGYDCVQKEVSVPVVTVLLGIAGFLTCARGGCAAENARKIAEENPRLKARFKRVDRS